jgi:ribosomal protein L3
LDKKESDATKGQKISYAKVAEFAVDSDFIQTNPAGTVLTAQLLDGVTSFVLSAYGKGKGFQGGMKRFHLK